MDKTTLSKRDQKKELKRQHILSCAEHLIIEQSLANLSMDAVARKAKVAKGTVYLYFESKEEIIASLTFKARTALLEKFQEAARQFEEPIDQVESIIMSNYDFSLEFPLYQELLAFYEGMSEYEETEALTKASKCIHTFLESVVQAAKAKGQIREDLDSNQFSLMVWGMSVGMVQLIKTKEPILKAYLPDTSKAFYESFAKLIIEGIQKK